MNNKYKKKLKAIFNEHGLSTQLKKLSEEVFELQEAITSFKNTQSIYLNYEGTPGYMYLRNNITEEFADVMVILNQIKEVYELSEDEIIEIMKYKIDRQCERDDISD